MLRRSSEEGSVKGCYYILVMFCPGEKICLLAIIVFQTPTHESTISGGRINSPRV